MGSYLLLVLVMLTSPAFAFDGAWDDLRGGESADAWETENQAYQEPDYPDPRDYFAPGDIEPGHIPYNCGHITSPRVRRDCQRDWEASDPNTYLNYGR